jgi:hypothetical protein
MANIARAITLISLLCFGLLAPKTAHAIEIKISAQALERTLAQQLFTADQGRYYIRGDAHSPCFVYADNPKVTFVEDRVVVHVHTHGKLGTSLRGACLGVSVTTEADVSVLPDAEGETIGFRDARVENLNVSKELRFFLEPFLSRKLPQKLSVNIAEVLRKVLAKSQDSTGYDIKLDQLKIHSMQVSGDTLIVDFDGQLAVH